MSKWMVKVTESCIYHIEVEADTSDEASEAAYNEFDQMEPHEKEVHFHDWKEDSETICRSRDY